MLDAEWLKTAEAQMHLVMFRFHLTIAPMLKYSASPSKLVDQGHCRYAQAAGSDDITSKLCSPLLPN